MTADDTPRLVQLAEDAQQAIRAINHLTLGGHTPAPVVYDALGSLKLVGTHLPQALMQIASGLGRSLDVYDVYEDDDRDPVRSVAYATDRLTRAAQLATELGEELDKAQSAISGQGFRGESPVL